jgi:HTH-type transcriptional regulator, competence development regulator
MELGAYIRQRRQLVGFSLRKFAAMLHVNPAYLSRVERGIVPPSDTLIQAIAVTLGTDAEAFLLLAGRVPQEWQQTIATAPRRAVEMLRTALVLHHSEFDG